MGAEAEKTGLYPPEIRGLGSIIQDCQPPNMKITDTTPKND